MALVLLLEHASSIFSILHIPSLFGKKDVEYPSLLSCPQTHHHCHWITGFTILQDYFCHVIVAFRGMRTQCRKHDVTLDCYNHLSGVHMNSSPTLPELQNKQNLSCILLVNKPFPTKKVYLLIQEKCEGFYWENIP